ncbi:hypothetical protein [uncultured Abyssibacter sp.]|uniref:hypothetical protein n=1 Tax=uncultured Abyssibacter sp. TaxID=2320202 RepID=UPI0032B14459
MNRTTKTASVFAQDQAERVRFGRSKEANDNAGLRENRPVPYRIAPENRPCGVARRSFGMTKFRSSRLAWPVFRRQLGGVNKSVLP